MKEDSFIDRYATPIGILGAASTAAIVLWCASLIGKTPDTDRAAAAIVAKNTLDELETSARRLLRSVAFDPSVGIAKIDLETAFSLIEAKALNRSTFFGATERVGVPGGFGLTYNPAYPLAKIPPIADDPARNEAILQIMKDPEQLEIGAEFYQALCLQCHGDKNLPGDNPSVLFDNLWYYVETPSQIERLLYVGIIEKGMPPWEGALTPEMSGAIVAYLLANRRD